MTRAWHATALTLALSCTACAPRAIRVPLSDAHRSAIQSTKVVANIPQDQVIATYQPSNVRTPAGVGFGLLGVVVGGLVDAAADNHRFKAALTGAAPIYEALRFHDPRTAAKAILAHELDQEGRLQGAKFEVVREPAMATAKTAFLDAAGTDAVLLLGFHYQLSPDFRYILFNATGNMLPTKTASAPEITALARTDPTPPLYYQNFWTAVAAPGGGPWTSDLAAAAVDAIDGGILEVVRMLAWDLEQPGPRNGRYHSSGDTKVKHPLLGNQWPGVVVREVDGRQWLRLTSGELASVGDTYPALGSIQGREVKVARVIGRVEAASYRPTSDRQAVGVIGGFELVHPAARAVKSAHEEHGAKQRAFGGTEAVPAELPSLDIVDRLENGLAVVAPDVEAYVRTAIAAELGKMGVATAEGSRPILRGEILEARTERSGPARGATLRVRWVLADGAGAVVWSDTKTSTTSPDDPAETEVDAFHAVLRKAAEALVLDPAFGDAVK